MGHYNEDFIKYQKSIIRCSVCSARVGSEVWHAEPQCASPSPQESQNQ